MNFNLSIWAVKNRQVVLYLILLCSVAGAIAYTKLSQAEDPPISWHAMMIRTIWPGASAEEVALQVTDRIEKKLMEAGEFKEIVSYSRPGESQVTFLTQEYLKPAENEVAWYQVRKKISDIRHTLPQGVLGPFFNDEFGTVYGNIYALTGEGYDYAVLKDYADRLQLQLQRVKDVGRIELLGLQDEKIWIELSNAKAANLGLPLEAVQQALNQQNTVAPAGFFETTQERVQLRVSGRFDSVDEIRNFPLRIGDRTFRISDVADVRRSFNDPPAPRMRFMGENAIGLAVSMKAGGDILVLGAALDKEFARLQETLPLGMQLSKVSDQPVAVKRGVGEFLRALAEALAIVLLVSFFSLGARSGLVVALSIPIVLAMTFSLMYYFDVGLHKISLGALILALGLLVDDAIIAVEMMAVKMEQGFDRIKAAGFAWSNTAFPMLTGTLITAAGFLPIATAKSGTGEYTGSIFSVVTIALVVSWFAAVVFVPYLGYRLLPTAAKLRAGEKAHDPYDKPFYTRFRSVLFWCVDNRKRVLLLTVAAFLVSLVLFKYIPVQFFPASGRYELMVDLKLAEGSSLKATESEAARLEKLIQSQPGIENYVAYIGSGAPRFYLPLDQQMPAPSFAQFVVLTKSAKEREKIRNWLIEVLDEQFPAVRSRVSRLENGPPVGYPIQLRLSGEHIDQVRQLARKVADKVRENPHVVNVHLNWEEPSKVVRLQIDQDRARVLGVSTADVSQAMQSLLSGMTVSTYREGNELIEVLLRGTSSERGLLSQLPSLTVQTDSGKSVALSQVATLEYGFEEGIIWRRDRLPTVTVRADIYDGSLPAPVTAQIMPTLAGIESEMPDGYRLEVGGTVEDSADGQTSVNAGIPLFLVVVLTLLMLQLRSFSLSAMVFLSAPFGLIGVVLFLLVFQQPFGFVAMLGTIALSGMIMRNSVILIDQIEKDVAAGSPRRQAIIDATVRRFRPIVLTALAAVLAMVPLVRSVFFGPMAVAIMGGLIVATVLTLLVLPALYAAWYRVKEGDGPVLQSAD
ncbi:efflux RND transporter permease subunit [Pseudomonas sp. N040]|uniref:efflux RND transporter permease subunit n=1 Tax=Pseudomonas sp. N040 TaxID=2785325 RepID=UPI0018A283D6|nr:efflux RND transporter permease subunit [Pseudomonas sp. N040]MBF7730615.1 efflux RND transporter permease subunit [Pseudomonas sp. N040]MBW7014258.1 efflux RND transporter permease subunit [Pseudomonas sp. N040]